MSNDHRTFTHPDVVRASLAGESWADPECDPTAIDWTTRQANAVIPFQVIDGRPVNPCETTPVRYGRNQLGHWGEQQCADALVITTDRHGNRWIVMVERADGHGWALPGGYVDPGESPAAAAVRELAEETGLDLSAVQWETTPPRYVPDPRASDEAWMVTTLCVAHLGRMDRAEFPEVTGQDDARRAEWIPASTYSALVYTLSARHHAEVFPAHVQMLRDALIVPPRKAKEVTVTITTFGYLHGAPPTDAHMVLDLRHHFRDPHAVRGLRNLTAADAPAVRTAVLNTPGIRPLISATADAALAYLSGPSATATQLTIAVGCAGGRHRAAAVGLTLAKTLTDLDVPVTLVHRDLDKPVVAR